MTVAFVALSLACAGASDLIIDEATAHHIAGTWVRAIIEQDGGWGEAPRAQIDFVEPLLHEEDVVGYVAHVAPTGFVVVPTLEPLDPIIAYSEHYDLDLDCASLPVRMISNDLGRTLEMIRRDLGALDELDRESLVAYVGADASDAWQWLRAGRLPSPKAMPALTSRSGYTPGDTLLVDGWSQIPPYNDHCPMMGCIWDAWFGPNWIGSQFYNNNAYTGCTATAGSQVMRYWSWPPNGEGFHPNPFQWTKLRNQYEWYEPWGRFVDETMHVCTTEEIYTVADLMQTVGAAVNMDYSCLGSGAALFGPWPSLQSALTQYFRYHDSTARLRAVHNDEQWWGFITSQIDLRRPLPLCTWDFGDDGHSLVIDGYRIDRDTRRYHVNYGHGPGADCAGHLKSWWYTLGSTLCGLSPQAILTEVYPTVAVGPLLSGYYPLQSFAYRYFAEDAVALSEVTFQGSQKHQFLPGVKVECTAPGTSLLFGAGASTPDETVVFARGDYERGWRSAHAGAGNSGLKIFAGGGMVVY